VALFDLLSIVNFGYLKVAAMSYFLATKFLFLSDSKISCSIKNFLEKPSVSIKLCRHFD